MARVDDAIQLLYEDASQREDLTDSEAEALFAWAEGEMRRLDQSYPDDDAFQNAVDALLDTVGNLNAVVGRRATAEASSQAAMLDKLAGNAAEAGLNADRAALERALNEGALVAQSASQTADAGPDALDSAANIALIGQLTSLLSTQTAEAQTAPPETAPPEAALSQTAPPPMEEATAPSAEAKADQRAPNTSRMGTAASVKRAGAPLRGSDKGSPRSNTVAPRARTQAAPSQMAPTKTIPSHDALSQAVNSARPSAESEFVVHAPNTPNMDAAAAPSRLENAPLRRSDKAFTNQNTAAPSQIAATKTALSATVVEAELGLPAGAIPRTGAIEAATPSEMAPSEMAPSQSQDTAEPPAEAEAEPHESNNPLTLLGEAITSLFRPPAETPAPTDSLSHPQEKTDDETHRN